MLDLDCLRQVAGAIDTLGFEGTLLPTRRSCEDAWVTASALIGATRRMKFLVAARPGLVSPSLAARMAATFDRLSGGQVLINVVTGGDPVELAGNGIFQAHDARYEVTDKFLHSWRRLRFGIRLHMIVRETDEEAWQAADRLISHVTDNTVAAAQKMLARQDSVGQKRMLGLQRDGVVDRSRTSLGVSPNLWAGVGLVRGGAGTALVGGADTVAARMKEYAEVGIETFILSGYPHLEEAYRVAELLFPRLPLSHDQTGGEGATLRPTHAWEVMANELMPSVPRTPLDRGGNPIAVADAPTAALIKP